MVFGVNNMHISSFFVVSFQFRRPLSLKPALSQNLDIGWGQQIIYIGFKIYAANRFLQNIDIEKNFNEI
jgi:hypothetical protein